jgi:hypothetical protein
MKYVLKNTAWRGNTLTVEELYMNGDSWSPYYHTDRLSEARIWNTFDDAADYDRQYGDNEHKVVKIKDKDLFEARLSGK